MNVFSMSTKGAPPKRSLPNAESIVSNDGLNEPFHSLVPQQLSYPIVQPTPHNVYQGSCDAPDRDTRGAVLLDTRQCYPPSSYIAPYAYYGLRFPLADVGSPALLLPSADTVSNLSPCIQPAPTSISALTSSTGYLYTDLDHVTLLAANSIPVPLSSSTNRGLAIAHSDQTRLPVRIHGQVERVSVHPYSGRRACAVNIEGLWIDTEDISTGSSQITVHECQWAQSTDPCGIWIIGSRSCMGAHIRKWHSKTMVSGKCLWDGCVKTMQRDSINRHIVSVHLGETFLCQGCPRTFSRQDVYGQHTKREKACLAAGAAIAYGTERREIDTHHWQALLRGNTVRYADGY